MEDNLKIWKATSKKYLKKKMLIWKKYEKKNSIQKHLKKGRWSKKMEDNLKKWKTTSKMEDNLKKNLNQK